MRCSPDLEVMRLLEEFRRPLPELADLLVGLEPGRFFRQSLRWALAKRKPLLDALVDPARAVSARRPCVSNRPNARLTWLTKEFASRHASVIFSFRPEE